MKKEKICLACSTGGHLKEMLQLKKFYSKHNYYFVTMDRVDGKSLAKKEQVYFVKCPARNPLSFLINFFQSWKVFRKENPKVIISTGADVALSTLIIGKLFRKKIIYIESFCRPLEPSVTGKIAYRFADLFIYQWKELAKYYPKGKFGGSIF